MRQAFVYILTNCKHTVFYVGVTSNLMKRVWLHKQKRIEGFTKKYNVTKLLYFEEHFTMQEAIQREKVLKKYQRLWKVRLITKMNPHWKDLFNDLS
jgi:putative endonuclease